MWEDALKKFQYGINFNQYIVGEPAVDDGGPLREFLRLLMGAIGTNNSFFQGEPSLRVPTCNIKGLEDQVYRRIGEMISVSLIHGGPSPAFLAPCVIDYMIHGMKARASVEEVPTKKIRKKLEEVSSKHCTSCMYSSLLK